MSAVAVESTTFTHNPLDVVEEIAVANEWPFERISDHEMVVELGGRWCDYRLFFVWQIDASAVQFSCQFDLRVQSARRNAIHDLLAEINAKMWLGHFDVCPEEQTPTFRYTMLLRGVRGVSVEQMEDLVEIALSECERFYPAFQFVIWGGKSAAEAVSAAILDTVGEA